MFIHNDWARADFRALLVAGYVWDYEYTVSLGNGGEDVLRFTTGDFPVVMLGSTYQVSGTRDLTLQLFEGGTVTTGIAVQPLPRNRNKPVFQPLIDIYRGATVSVGGTLMTTIQLGDQSRGDSNFENEKLILLPSTKYYAELKNNDSQTATVNASILAARCPEVGKTD